MIGLVRNEWKKVFLPVLLTTVLLAIAMGVLSCTIYQNYVLHYDLEAWEVGTELFSLLYPLFVVVPLCWNLYYERKNNFLLYIMPRVKIKKYLTAKWIAYALGTLCIIVIPYILSAVFALYVKPPVVPFVENPFSHIFENAFIKTPLLYAVALSLWRGIVSLFVEPLKISRSISDRVDCPPIDAGSLTLNPGDTVAVEVKKSLARHLAGREFTVSFPQCDHTYTIQASKHNDWHEFTVPAEEEQEAPV